jgi:hypothetical protein
VRVKIWRVRRCEGRLLPVPAIASTIALMGEEQTDKRTGANMTYVVPFRFSRAEWVRTML